MTKAKKRQLFQSAYITCNTLTFAGEIFELKAELNCDKKDRKKEAVKKVIASMTVGKDVRYVGSSRSLLGW